MTKVIEINGLSKKYLIPHANEDSYSTLVDTLTCKIKDYKRALLNPFKKNKTVVSERFEEFWALKNLTFDVEQGDCIGIVGKNGAGKSTLLKILSRITAPTEGSIRIKGRTSSLLEVGTGFHQELTGRENIFLNGTILGMRRKEIEKKFDEIVAFSEIEQFLDTPVKRYSSGMFTRLGFAIAAHLESDVLIVDEVLAVGDAAFQEKCLKKLRTLGTSGRTVLFVSHDVGSVLTLCNKGVYLEHGQLKEAGDIEHCVNAYMKSCKTHDFEWTGSIGDENIQILRVKIIKENSVQEFFYQGDQVKVEITYEAKKPTRDLYFGIGIWNQRHQMLARSTTADITDGRLTDTKSGMNKLTFTIDTSIFHEGEYLIKFECFIHNIKRILNDEIILKCPIYLSEKNLQHNHRDGIFLGNHWIEQQISEVSHV